MGTFTYPLEVISADGTRTETVDATVGTGSTYTCLPASLLHELGIAPRWSVQSELADGSVVEDSIGEARVRVEGIEIPTVVTFIDDNAPPQLGKYTLTGALLVADPVRQRLVPTHALRISRRTTARQTWTFSKFP